LTKRQEIQITVHAGRRYYSARPASPQPTSRPQSTPLWDGVEGHEDTPPTLRGGARQPRTHNAGRYPAAPAFSPLQRHSDHSAFGRSNRPANSRPGHISPGVTEPALVLHSPNSRLIPHQVPARFRPRTGQTRRLCVRSIPLRFNSAGSISTSLHSTGPKPPRQAGTSCAPVKATGREASPDPDQQYGRDAPHVAQDTAIARDASHGQDAALRREAPPVAEDTVVGREASPGQDIGNSREHGHFPDATLRWRSVSPPGRMADLTDKTKLV